MERKTLRQQMERKCKYFTGIMNDTCEVGISYRSVRQDDRTYSEGRLPCTAPVIAHICDQYTPYTDEEIEKRESEVKAMIQGVAAFQLRDTEDCPQCGGHVTRIEQVSRCVYATPCGCRLWQGTVPDAWK
jgi:hypothetical protein